MSSKAKSRLRQDWLGYLFILPFCGFFAIFKLYPMVYGFLVSFLDRNAMKKITTNKFVGLLNYQKVLTSSGFWPAFARSLEFSLIYVTLIMVLGFLVAILLNKKFKGRAVVRTMFYMPYVTNVIAIGIVFTYLFNPSKGPINGIFRLFGWEGPQWLMSPILALPTAVVVAVYVAMAFNVITVLAALQDIPKDYFEVAELEGANAWQRVRYVIFPLLIPTLFMLLTIAVISSFKNYAIVFSLTDGGPGSSSRVMSILIYQDAFTYYKYSIASAEGVIYSIFVILVNKGLDHVRSAWERS